MASERVVLLPRRIRSRRMNLGLVPRIARASFSFVDVTDSIGGSRSGGKPNTNPQGARRQGRFGSPLEIGSPEYSVIFFRPKFSEREPRRERSGKHGVEVTGHLDPPNDEASHAGPGMTK
jgi:hypothetical protein